MMTGSEGRGDWDPSMIPNVSRLPLPIARRGWTLIDWSSSSPSCYSSIGVIFALTAVSGRETRLRAALREMREASRRSPRHVGAPCCMMPGATRCLSSAAHPPPCPSAPAGGTVPRPGSNRISDAPLRTRNLDHYLPRSRFGRGRQHVPLLNLQAAAARHHHRHGGATLARKRFPCAAPDAPGPTRTSPPRGRVGALRSCYTRALFGWTASSLRFTPCAGHALNGEKYSE